MPIVKSKHPQSNAEPAPRGARGRAAEGRMQRPIDRGTRSRRDPAMRRTGKPRITLEQTSQTAILRTCMDTISESFVYCLEQGGQHVEPEHLRAHLDAWDLLGATASLIARGSAVAQDAQEVCARAVRACQESCEDFQDDEMMVACADVCREAYEHLTA